MINPGVGSIDVPGLGVQVDGGMDGWGGSS